MDKLIEKLINNEADNYILPFLWMKGESEAIIREEIEKIDECGIKAICLESRPHPDFMGDKWWSDVELILQEAKKRSMKVWILDDAHFPTGYANGLIKTKYPERKKKYLNYNRVNVWGTKGEITIPVTRMLKPLVSFLELDKPRDFEEQKKNRLVSVVAYPVREDNKLDENGAIDLTGFVQEGYVTYTFPEDNYCVFVVYETATDGGTSDYINMMDKESVSTILEAVYEPHYAHFKEEFGKTIAGFFSDEPEIGNIGGFLTNVQIGNPNMPLPWSEQLKVRMIAKYGEGWHVYLPLLWTKSVQMETCAQLRYDFMDIVSSLYSEYFSQQLGEWCKSHDIEYIGHVVEDDNLHGRLGNGAGHYFRAMKGQHMAGIDVIGNQVAFGGAGYLRSGIFDRDGEFLHYALGKLGASSGHLDPNKEGRTMCELFGASGWKTGVREMKWILDHLLVRGINRLVPHAFSMAEYPDMDCPPHFYARGNNPQFKQFGNLMKYANRMCEVFSGGKHMAKVAVLYHAEAEWSGDCMLIQKPAKELLQHQVEFDFVSVDMLADLPVYKGKVNESSFAVNEQEFQCLVIPYVQNLSLKVFEFITSNPKLKVIFIEALPENVLHSELSSEEVQEQLKEYEVIELKKLREYLKDNHMTEIQLQSSFAELVCYHYQKDTDCFMLNNESAFETFTGEILLPFKHGAVFYDGLKNEFYRMEVTDKNGQKAITLELRPHGSCVIFDCMDETLPKYQTLSSQLMKCTKKTDISKTWSYSLAKAKEYPSFGEVSTMDNLLPISRLHPKFSGYICYEKEMEVAVLGEQAYLEFTKVFESMELWVNDTYVGDKLHPPYIFDISGLLIKGTNTIRAIVTTTLDRDQLNYPDPFIVLNFDNMESTGMYGEIWLYE
jgi:hypothetical protein